MVLPGSPLSDDTAAKISALNAFVLSPELRELENKLADFNVFRVLRFEHGEIRHSNVLGWLLQTDETHGLGDAFLRRWLMRILADTGSKAPTGVEVDGLAIRSVKVYREWPTDDGFIDLLLRVSTFEDGDWIVAVENKVRSHQSLKQLERYRMAVEATFPSDRRILVFLTRDREPPADSSWLPANYDQVRDELHGILAEYRDSLGSEPLMFLQHYLNILKTASMPKNEISQLVRKLYAKHRRAIDVINENLPSFVGDCVARLNELLEADAKTLGIETMASGRRFVRFLPSEWDNPENRQGRSWGSVGSAHVLCEIQILSDAAPEFCIVCGKPPADWTREMWSLMKTRDYPREQSSSPLPQQWAKPYFVRAPFELGEDITPDAAAAAKRVWEWVKQEISSKRFRDAVLTISSHIPKLRG